MKKILFILLLLIVSSGLYAQETVSETKEYVPYQDTLFILKTTTITNNGIEGINDTLVDYTPPPLDTAGLLQLLYTEALNNSNEKIALLRRALNYRKINSDKTTYKGLISGLGGDLDSFNVAAYKNNLKGRWRYIDNLGVRREFDLIDHPNRADMLRMDEDGGVNENMNVTVEGRWSITVRMNLKNVTFNWSGEDRDKPTFYLEKFWLPGSATSDGFDNSRWKKVD